jgi:hypothetical protein
VFCVVIKEGRKLGVWEWWCIVKDCMGILPEVNGRDSVDVGGRGGGLVTIAVFNVVGVRGAVVQDALLILVLLLLLSSSSRDVPSLALRLLPPGSCTRLHLLMLVPPGSNLCYWAITSYSYGMSEFSDGTSAAWQWQQQKVNAAQQSFFFFF